MTLLKLKQPDRLGIPYGGVVRYASLAQAIESFSKMS